MLDTALQYLDTFRFGLAAALDDITANHAVFGLITCITLAASAAAFLFYRVEIKD